MAAVLALPTVRPRSDAVILEAARCWRRAVDRGAPVQPQLFALLSRHDHGMLAPVLDSLLSLWQLALGRPARVGRGRPSADEALLLAWLAGTSRPDCPHGLAHTLDCALCSTRIMLGLSGRSCGGPAGKGRPALAQAAESSSSAGPKNS